ncbi:MAG: group II intron reverse transcriptase/maturase [Candidatus Latescibacteria bacterium]|nr:group II intron reverse transcriptase/maturase [Candidatus Latescibacterota bacterium]
MSQTQRWRPICLKLIRVQEKAARSPQERFTSLAHLITEKALWRSYQAVDAKAAPGVDGVTKDAYGANLYRNLEELHWRLKHGKYRASPVLRHWIEKPDGGQRPLGIPTVEDKIVQGVVVELLNSIYEVDFLSFSYGFRPGKSQHHALQALQTVLQKGNVNWVLDADISKFFDSIDHKELMAVLKHRVNDRNVLRLIGKWLSAGVVEKDGRRIREKKGTPQGGVISPLLANIFLHYIVDVFVHTWRKTEAKGEVYIVRYADDFIIGCEYRDDALILLEALEKRLDEHGLTLNREKTRLVRFGRRWDDGNGNPRPETFDFLGFTHISGKDRQGRYLIKRKTARKRFSRSLKSIAEWCTNNRHLPVSVQWKQLRLKLSGHYNYYGVRGNFKALARFRHEVWKLWFNALKRRSQKVNKNHLYNLISSVFVLPTPKITHPEGWLDLNPGYLLGRAGCGNSARPVL